MESHFSSKIKSVCKVYIQQHNHLPRNQQKNHNKVVVRVGEKKFILTSFSDLCFPFLCDPQFSWDSSVPSKSSSTEMI